ncbi:hypothetical protein HF324_18275 [Chitinophaga oryzae]|uniref:DUF1735 domain-containing protein n=2 Tax=Chitinophaga TaxID=79328 RepID=A0AAE6ZI90_9BACT|nr:MULTISPECIES: hypothetical protein [Chitinophaga]QJB33223.1 hypothetical protein HF329_18635 [Chitinophaga oryzae]QJB39699.1 hypothetical protein HF324_18275 [Chitinophaga oryzae]SJZ56161.1 hypothetical protein SAMN04488128_101729 [Chitinophaga eiseniae]
MKTWLYLPLLLLAVVFSSCTKNYNEVIPNKTIFYDVSTTTWKLDNQGVYYVQFDVPELDQNSSQLDGVVVSVARQQNGGYNLFELLPEVFNNEYYNVIHQAGTLLVELRGPNGTQAQKPTVNMRFKIVIIPANNAS